MISVIIPVYNVEEYLNDCLLSVLNQTYSDLEIICVEDCSTDSSLEILENFANIDDRIRIVRNKVNSSLGFSRNEGLKYASGEYILFLDSDDWIDFKTIEILYDKSKKDNLDVLIFKAINYDDNKRIFYHEDYYDLKYMDKYLNKVFNHEDLTSNEFININVSAWNKFYSRAFLEEHDLKFPVKLIHEDNPFFYEWLSKAKRVSLIDNYFYNRRRRMGSITTSNGKEILDCVDIADKCAKIAFNNKNVYNKHKAVILTKFVRRMYVKYNFIDNKYRNEFYKKARKFFIKLSDEYNWSNDFKVCLNDENYKLYEFFVS